MSVYIEYVIADNLIMDSLIVFFALKTAKASVKWYLVLLSAALGTAVAVILPLFELDSFVLIAVKIGVSLAMTLIASAANLKKYFLNFALLYVYTFLIGGSCFGLLYLLGDISFEGGAIAYRYDVPIGILAGGGALGVFFICFLISYIKKHKRLGGVACEAEITACGGRVRVKGIVDTGNLLTDTDTGYPVAVVAASVLTDLTSCAEKMGRLSKLKQMHYAEFNTVSTKSAKIMLFKPDRFILYYADKAHIITDIMVGIAPANIFSGECKLLMPLS